MDVVSKSSRIDRSTGLEGGSDESRVPPVDRRSVPLRSAVPGDEYCEEESYLGRLRQPENAIEW
jgi:hypothetical protein